MMWLILTPFLVLCLAAVGLTLAEAADFIRARRSDSPRPHLSKPWGFQATLGNQYSFSPKVMDDGMSGGTKGAIERGD